MLAKLLERAIRHQLHPHWSDAAFDAERLVDRRVLLETGVQLEARRGGGTRKRDIKDQLTDKGKTYCLLLLCARFVSPCIVVPL